MITVKMRMMGGLVALALLGAGRVRADVPTTATTQLTYPVVDAAQDKCYSDSVEIAPQKSGAGFCGQDAQTSTRPPAYAVSADKLTVLDRVTGLTWVRTPDLDGDGKFDSNDKLTWSEFAAEADRANARKLGGFDDWRVPTIKELYSLMDFRGVDLGGGEALGPGAEKKLRPFLDRKAFAFCYGDSKAGERPIDAQYLSATQYVSTTMRGGATVFGVNFADGRIKGYPRDRGGSGRPFKGFLRLVRGNPEYGKNKFIDNGDGTITDAATGLMWMKSDSGKGMDWKTALTFADSFTLAGHTDWRLPDAKELQSIVDYSRSPDTTNSAAIDPVFNATAITNEGGKRDWPFYWTSTTHVGSRTAGSWAAYVCFGRGLGWMSGPRDGGKKVLLDVHGAGAQRSDPKVGDARKFSTGHGPQGDVVRIQNHVRCVRSEAVRK